MHNINTDIQELIIRVLNNTEFDVNPDKLIPLKIDKEHGVIFKFDTTKDAKLFKQLLNKNSKGITVNKYTVTICGDYNKESTVRQAVEFIREYLCIENNMEYKALDYE